MAPRIAGLLAAIWLPLSGCAVEPQSCDDLAAHFNKSPTIEEKVALVNELEANGCGEFASLGKRSIANRLAAELDQLSAEASAERLALAERVLEFDPDHPGALLVRSEAHLTSKRWAEAAEDSGRAMLALIDLDRQKPNDPRVARDLDRAYRINGDARTMATTFVARDTHRGDSLCEFARTRSGSGSGDIAYAVLAEPIEFVSGKDEFTAKGRLAADAITAHLYNGCLTRDAVLLGHTDPNDTAAYNCTLAEARLQAVERHIRAYFQTHPGDRKMPRLTLVPQGEGHPRGQFPEGLSKGEKFQLLRRVEFRDASARTPPACDPTQENLLDYGH